MDPVLEGILTDLNKVTDFSEMIKLQGKHKLAEKAADVADAEDGQGDDSEKSTEPAVDKEAKAQKVVN